MPDAVGAGERNGTGAGGHVREDIILGEEKTKLVHYLHGDPAIPEE